MRDEEIRARLDGELDGGGGGVHGGGDARDASVVFDLKPVDGFFIVLEQTRL